MEQEPGGYQRPEPKADANFRGVHPLSITGWLIIINIVCYSVEYFTTVYIPLNNGLQIKYDPLYDWGAFIAQKAVYHGQVWRFITFQFLHANLTHIAFNMMALFFFGPLMEEYLGRVKFLAFYLLCGMAGPVSYLLFYGLHVSEAQGRQELIGASAGVFGILIAAAQVLPDVKVLIYGIIPARLSTVAWILLGIAIYTVFTNGNNAGGEAAHLGGAALGYVLIKNERWLDFFGWAGAERRG